MTNQSDFDKDTDPRWGDNEQPLASVASAVSAPTPTSDLAHTLSEKEAKRAKAGPMPTITTPAGAPFPSNAFYGPDGKLYHYILKMTEGGSYNWNARRLATSLEQARDERLDYYHPLYGLIWEGFKLARTRDEADRITNMSTGGLARPGQIPVPV